MNDLTIAIASDNLSELESSIAAVSLHQDWIQLDISDGSLVEFETITDLNYIKNILNKSGRSFEAHLIVNDPYKYVKKLSDMGFKRLIAHVESNDPRRFLEEAELEGIEAGIALLPTSEIEVIEPFIEEADFTVVMTAEIKSSESPFLPENVEKIRTLSLNAPDEIIAVEGGLNPQNARIVKEAGATRLVVSHEVFTRSGDSFMSLLSEFRSI